MRSSCPTSVKHDAPEPTARTRVRRKLLCLVTALLLCAAPAAATAQSTSQTTAPRATESARTTAITGHVQDPTGAIIPGAKIELQRPDGTIVSTVVSDSAGQFRIAQPAPGDYRLAIALPGFEPLARPLRVGQAPLAPISLTMNLASVSTVVNVDASQNVDTLSSDQNQDSPSVNASDIKTLPIFDNDIVGTLSAFLDAGIAGETGTTLVIDGVEKSTLGVAPSAVENVTINQDPYSARYSTPGRGQMEITTKSTADHFHGTVTFNYRNSALNATNYFATSKPPENREIYEGFLTGPIKPLHNTAFLFTLNRQVRSYYSQVNATTIPVPTPAQNVFTPSSSTNLTMKVSHQYSDRHSGYVMYEMYNGSATSQNIGGIVQASVGYVSYNFDQDIIYRDDFILSANKLNQFSFIFEDNHDSTVSNSKTPQTIVQGVTTFGGAQNDSLQTEYNPNISDVFTWTHRIHQFKFGVQLPNMGRRILEDKTNRQGTYTFASLAAYQAQAAGLSSVSIQQGQSRFLTHYLQPQAFFQDQIQLTPRLTASSGVRYFWQNTLPGTMDGIQPRLSFAYMLDKKHAMVLRVGSGIYFRRVGVNIGQQLARYQYAAEQSLLLTTNLTCYPYDPNTDSYTTCTYSGPPSLFNFQPNLKSPVQGYYGLSLERQVTAKSTLTVAYGGYRGWHALRSIDINAPLPPFTSPARPNPNYAQVLQLNSGGYQKSDGLTVSFRGRIGNVYSGFLQYGWQHAGSDTEFSTFIPENQYNPNAEWSRTDNDQRQRLSMLSTFFPDRIFNLGIGFYDYSGTPYSITTGQDNYYTGLFNARPTGVPRNSLQSSDFQNLELRWNYNHKLRPQLKDASPVLGFSVSSFNTLNRVNFDSFVGVQSSPLFMQPTQANSPRRLQLGASFTF
jgi:Carboxypeptidase regulatory-like domain